MSGVRIIAGRYKGRTLLAPDGGATRPTNIRARQAVFDILMHAPWCDLQTSHVLDVFAGTGAYGLEALSRGARHVSFIEHAPAALKVLKANIAACTTDNTQVFAVDALTPPPGQRHDLVFLDPPYGQNLLIPAIIALTRQGWIGTGSLIVAETGPDETLATPEPLAYRRHGKAQLKIWRVEA